jgi:hypothetical protein
VNDDADADDDDVKGKSRGTNLTPTDKLMICKAYIATSEDPIHGNKIGSAVFCDKLSDNYRLLYQGYIEEQHILYNQQLRASECSNGNVHRTIHWIQIHHGRGALSPSNYEGEDNNQHRNNVFNGPQLDFLLQDTKF